MKAELKSSKENDLNLDPEAMIRDNENLKKRIIELNTQLNASKKELDTVIYSMSHDLRAPLRAIDGYSRILEQDYAATLDEEGLRILNIVRSSTKYMDELISNLLMLSRVGSCDLASGTIDMNALVNSVIQELSTPGIKDQFKFSITDLPASMGDPALIRQVWMNLVSNSIKFSRPKTKPEINISGFEDPDQCTYRIKDNGVGFNPKYRDKLFELFQHLHKTTDFKGTGIGLTIVQRIILRHGGRIWGDGLPNEGAEFSFTLPKKQGSAEY